ncbi:MAG: class I SAM-dependent methyltransferase [Prochlorococcus marinus XMU1422]|nr:class I SAM-dependent methyltransferase [Prochlorococcus marinus XMU1421]MBO7013270.1 class I SAM-dependent methyltransferase [Prochlorococcus marinus XMU1422]MCR8542275.1 methyltransferase domain-containing protein [Prochlorococcus marinus XMU1423]
MFACPLCKEPFRYNLSKVNLKCENSSCKLFDKKFLKHNGVPLLIPFGEKYCVFKNKTQSRNLNLGYKRRDKFSKFKKFKFKSRKFFYGENNKTKINYRKIRNLISTSSRILVIGGGTIGEGASEFYNWCEKNEIEIISLDVYFSENINVVADAHYLPFPNNYFDLVIMQSVIQYFLLPDIVINEVFNVLKKNGIIYAETPFLQPVNEGAYDFYRYTHSGHRILFNKFEELSSGFLKGAFSSSLLIFSYAISALFKNKIIGVLIRILFTRFFTLFDYLIDKKFNFDTAFGCFFIGIKRDKSILKFKINQVTDYYKGGQ